MGGIHFAGVALKTPGQLWGWLLNSERAGGGRKGVQSAKGRGWWQSVGKENEGRLHSVSSPVFPRPEGQSTALPSLSIAFFVKLWGNLLEPSAEYGKGDQTSTQLLAHRPDTRNHWERKERQQADLWATICYTQPPRPSARRQTDNPSTPLMN